MLSSRNHIAFAAIALVALATLVAAADKEAGKAPKEDLLASQPKYVEGAYFLETFTDPIEGRWVKSQNKMYTGNAALKQQASPDPQGIPGDAGLVLTEESKRYGVAAPFDKETVPGKELVIQFENKLASMIDCAGAYIKVLEAKSLPKLEDMEEKTSYTVMFGPDKCGATNKVHLILRFKNAKTGEYKEHHLKNPPAMKNDKLPHLYTAVLRPDNTFDIYIDQVSVKSGSLTSASDWESGGFTPPKEIDDPSDKKPSDWVDEEKMKDPAAKKPDDWDESAPKMIDDADAKKPPEWDESAKDKVPDPDAKKPGDWDEDEDGAWEAPLVTNPKCKTGCGPWKRPQKANPAYKGKWEAPMIKNPKYKGIWKPKRIANPGYYEVTDPVSQLAPMGAVAIEVWVHKPNGILFDNILVGDDLAKAQQFGAQTWKVRADNEKKAARAIEEKAKAEAREKRLSEGGFWVTMEEYTKIGAEAFAAYPYISFPMMLLFFFLIFKFCRGEKDKDKPRRPVSKNPAKEEEEEEEEEEKDDDASVSQSASQASESVAEEEDSGKESKSLRQRKGGKKKKEAKQDGEEDDKDK